MTGIAVLVIDPPWPKRKGGKRRVRPQQGRALDYPTMSVGEIFALLDQEILPRAAETHSVFLWTVDQLLHDAESEMESRGYRRHARFIWDKENGVAPCFTIRYAHEYLIWFYKPKLSPVAPEVRGKYTTVIREAARQHSRKPEAAYQMVQMLYPDVRRMDVFSREARAGWEQFGNECDYFSKGVA